MSHGPASISRLEIHLLGPFRIAVDGEPVEERRWARRKPKLLVKLLALQPHHQLHREQVIELLWPELDSESAGANLYKTVHLARRALEPESDARAGSSFILTQDQQVTLRAPGELWIDLEAFEQRATDALASSSVEAVEGALELYSGDLLPEHLYEDWAAGRREHARSLYLELLARLTRLYDAAGEYQRGIECLRIMLASDPTNEEAHRQLMRLYAQTGSRHSAAEEQPSCWEVRQASARRGWRSRPSNGRDGKERGCSWAPVTSRRGRRLTDCSSRPSPATPVARARRYWLINLAPGRNRSLGSSLPWP